MNLEASSESMLRGDLYHLEPNFINFVNSLMIKGDISSVNHINQKLCEIKKPCNIIHNSNVVTTTEDWITLFYYLRSGSYREVPITNYIEERFFTNLSKISLKNWRQNGGKLSPEISKKVIEEVET